MTKHNWHPFPEETPPQLDHYLVFCSNKNINFALYMPGQGSFAAGATFLFEVTHWMELPLPPGSDEPEEELLPLPKPSKPKAPVKAAAKPKVTKAKTSVKKPKAVSEPPPEPELFNDGIVDHG